MRSPTRRAAATDRPLRSAAAVLVGLAVLAHPTVASAASPTGKASAQASTRYLDFTVSGADDSTRLFTTGVPGGGQMVSIFQMPGSDGSTPTPRELTLTVEAKAVAAAAATVMSGSMVPAAGSGIEQDQDGDSTTVKVEAGSTSRTIFLLPQQAPKAADPDDQNFLEKLWGQVTGLISGDDDSSSDDSDDSSSKEPTAASTSSPTASSSSRPTSSSSPTEDASTPTATDAAGGSPATSPSTSTPTSDCWATAGPVTDSQEDRTASQRHPQDSASSDRDPSSGPTGPAAQPTTTPTSIAMGSKLAKACAPAPSETTGGAEDPTSGDGSGTPTDTSTNTGTTTGTSTGAKVTLQNQASGLPFMLGASGEGVANGSYAKALGRDIDIAATWANDNQNMVDLPQLQPGGEYGSWTKALDISIGAIDQSAGESWAAAASGAYDDRWTKSIQNMKKLRADADGDTYIRFAHEWNGSWFPWSVKAGDTENFKKAWQHFADLAHGIWPQAKLVMSQNRESNGYTGNWEDAFPGAQYVDALNVDYYNNWPYAATLEDFTADLDEKDGWGGPKGLNAHAQFAKSVGLSLSLGEWSGVQGSEGGDSPAFIQGSYDYFTQHAGTGPGQILYVCQFNVASAGSGKFNLLMGTQQPQASQEFKKLFGKAD